MLTIELVFNITPPPCAFITFAADCAQLNTAVTLIFIILSKSSGL